MCSAAPLGMMSGVWGGLRGGQRVQRDGGLEVRGQLPRPPDSSQFTSKGFFGDSRMGYGHLNVHRNTRMGWPVTS